MSTDLEQGTASDQRPSNRLSGVRPSSFQKIFATRLTEVRAVVGHRLDHGAGSAGPIPPPAEPLQDLPFALGQAAGAFALERVEHPVQFLAVDGVEPVPRNARPARRRAGFHGAVERVVRQVTPTTSFRAASWSGASDPCLQAADYCAWAVQRKWEVGDLRSYALIQAKIATEFDVFRMGTAEYY